MRLPAILAGTAATLLASASPGVGGGADEALVADRGFWALEPRHLKDGVVYDSCPIAQDILILADSSASVGEDGFIKQKQFLMDFVTLLPAMPPVKVGVMRFENDVSLISAIEADRQLLLQRLGSMGFVIGETRLGLALQQAFETLVRHQEGDHTDSTNRPPLVLVLTDGEPNDKDVARQEAVKLKDYGARLVFLFVDADSTGSIAKPPPILEEMSSQPSSANIISLSGHTSLDTSAVKELLRMVVMPCGCQPGLSAELRGPEWQATTVTTTELLGHGDTEVQDCWGYFPAYSGDIVILCDDATLKVQGSCSRFCEAGYEMNINVPGFPDGAAVRIPKRINSGAEQEMPCAEVLPETGGMLTARCHEGVATATHNCAKRCEGAASVPIAFELPDGSTDIVMLNMSSEGMDHSERVTQSCSSMQPRGAVGVTLQGAVGVLCAAGQVEVLGSCTATTPATDEDCDGPDAIVYVLAIICVVLAPGNVAYAMVVFGKKPKKQEPESSAEVQAEPPEMPQIMQPVCLPPPPCPAPAPAPKMCSSVLCQTPPQVYVELSRGVQEPLDLVCCIDSSSSVGHENFMKSVAFVERLLLELETPPSEAGVIQFHHEYLVVSQMTWSQKDLQKRLRSMKYEPGETKLAPVLQQAAMMLRLHSETQESPDPDRKQVVLVLTDGDPNDLQESLREAIALKGRGVIIIVVAIGDAIQPQVIRSLASIPAERFALELHSFDELLDISGDVLRAILDISLWVRRARCAVDLLNYKPVADLDAIPGYELMVPGWEQQGSESWAWHEDSGRALRHYASAAWDGPRPHKPVKTQQLALADAPHVAPHPPDLRLAATPHQDYGWSEYPLDNGWEEDAAAYADQTMIEAANVVPARQLSCQPCQTANGPSPKGQGRSPSKGNGKKR
eukprot:gnl/TRDRNA2_/TRDRNA2_45166_c0_seq1.p1 gnl/TRDRNA2_/TRDRNA2_45166_c0~~gnl/TRDRNA2_/TRDRNA2_45166_c0_seq1.p1  ORF type:complete len:905 (-),score=176.23 gnl/TRDRNA2_/TRDRNA2_45166_c0_seq1:102-2816(-)